MTIRFRTLLMLLAGSVALLTLSTVGIFWYLSARNSAQKLSEQVLEKTALGIEEQVEKYLGDADFQCHLTAELLKSGQLKLDAFSQLVDYWRSVLTVDPDVTSMYLALDSTGEALGVSRVRGDPFIVWQTKLDRSTDHFEMLQYELPEYPRHAFYTESPGPDMRERPWYVAARKSQEGFWTHTYVFLGLKDFPNVLGVTFTLPLRTASGALEAVLTADFDLSSLSRFLANLSIGETGCAFLLEWQDDRQMYVVAHPQADLLLINDDTKPGKKKLTPASQFADPLVQAFLQQLPATLAPDKFPVSGNLRFTAAGENYLGSFRKIVDPLEPPWLICVFLPEDEVLAETNRVIRLTTIVTLAVIALAMVLCFSLSREVAEPLEHLTREVIAAGRLRLDADPMSHSIVQEVNNLALAEEEMKSGLRSFQKYLPADLVRTLIDSGHEAELGGTTQQVTIWFSDIVGFTSIAESIDAEALVAHLGDYLGALSDVILKLDGTVDKFIGDAIMAFWGAPHLNPQHAASACAAAIRCQLALHELRSRWQAAGKPAFKTRIGIHTGDVIVGNIGSPKRMNFTVIGDAVNLASRLEGLNKIYRTEIIVSEATYERAKADVVARPLDWVVVKGRAAPVLIFELLGMRSEVAPEVLEFSEMYSTALDHYKNRRWTEAIQLLQKVLRNRPGDYPAQMLTIRCREFLANPPPDNWDAALYMKEK